MKLTTSISFRGLSKILNLMNPKEKAPSHTTILNWVKQLGYYRLTKEKAKSDNWVIILDETVQLGNDKLLVILGIKESDLEFNRALKISDLEILLVKSKKNWTGEMIEKELKLLKEKGIGIKYAVGDYGGNLKKALELSEIPHVHDLTHVIALILEKEYKNDEKYKMLSEEMSKMREKYSQTELGHLIPPKQRKKSRFHNINEIFKWSYKMLKFVGKIKESNNDLYEKLKWILEFKELIYELKKVRELIVAQEKILKNEGLSRKTMKRSRKLLKKSKNERINRIKDKFCDYLIGIKKILPNVKNILITSDVIESAFGKYKNYISSNPMAGITDLSLSISAFTSDLNDDEIQKAFENTELTDVKKWSEIFIGDTLYSKRKKELLAL